MTAAALEYAAMGWRVVPILAGEKRPAITAWTRKATIDPDFITAWWRAHPTHGIGIATGPESGIFVLDVDNANGKQGDETLRRLEATNGELPAAYMVNTGSGGRHYYFKYPGFEIRNDASKRLGLGLDIRGIGGQVVAPPTIHPNGVAYTLGSDDPVSEAPAWLLDLLHPQDDVGPEPSRMDTDLDPDDDRPGTRFNQTTTWDQLLTADGWTPHHQDPNGEAHWTRPGKQRREGTSATVGYQGLDILHVFTSSVPGLDPDTSYNRFGYITATRYKGDYSTAAKALLATNTPGDDLAAWAQHIQAQTPLLELAPIDPASRFQPGGTWLLSAPDQVPVRWGEDDRVLWAQGEPLIIAGPPGVGKTTIASQLVMALTEVGDPDVLGLAVEPARRVLVLACDRPDQLRRAFRRRVTPEMREQLDERLIIWPGPPPEDLARNTKALYQLCLEADADVVFIDSLKDVALGLTDDEVGAGINQAMQIAVANGIDVTATHHQRKRQQGAGKPKTLDDLYGSTWIAAGAGSVVLLYGEAGDPVVDLIHVKQPCDVVGPWRIAHDQQTGLSSVVDGEIDIAFLLGNTPHGLGAGAIVQTMLKGKEPTDADRRRMKRRLDRLVEAGDLERIDGGHDEATGRQRPDIYKAVRLNPHRTSGGQ